MFILANVIEAVAFTLDKVLWIYTIIVMIAVLISWVSPDPFNPIVQILRSATEPLFDWIRRHFPFVVVGMLDLSPIVTFFAIQLIQMIVVHSLVDLAARLR